MNALRVLLLLTLFIYFGYFEFQFLKYFVSVLTVYYLSTVIFLRKNRIETSKLNFMMSMWTYPNDPTIYVKYKYDLTETLEKLDKLSKKHGIKIGLTALLIKAKGLMLKDFSLANTVIVFGKVGKKIVL
jgi:hypothetical protein